jgi:hypothetical protein
MSVGATCLTTAVLGGILAVAGALVAAERSMTVTVEDHQRYCIKLGNEEVTKCYTSAEWAKPFLFPLLPPNNAAVTRSWPIESTSINSIDHIHQKSAWFAHGEVTLEVGAIPPRPIDFWAEAPGHGVIVVKKPEQCGPGQPLVLECEWRGSDGKQILAERRTLSVYAVEGGRLVVFRTDLRAAFGAVVFGDTKEGAFAVRVHDQLRVGDKGKSNSKSVITNADGKEGEKGCWGRLSDWCDYSGEIDGKQVGIAVFDDPSNRPRSCWHVRDYGLMAGNPFGRSKAGFPAMHGRSDVVRLKYDEHLSLRYGIFLHVGNSTAGRVAAAYSEFVRLRN